MSQLLVSMNLKLIFASQKRWCYTKKRWYSTDRGLSTPIQLVFFPQKNSPTKRTFARKTLGSSGCHASGHKAASILIGSSGVRDKGSWRTHFTLSSRHSWWEWLVRMVQEIKTGNFWENCSNFFWTFIKIRAYFWLSGRPEISDHTLCDGKGVIAVERIISDVNRYENKLG